MKSMKKGNTLLETIVAIGVLMTGLLSVMTLVISNVTAQRDAAMRYRAINFAREGIELVRNMRDSNWLQAKGTWDRILPYATGTPYALAVNPGTTSLSPGTDRIFIDAVDPNTVICQTGTTFTQGEACATPSPFLRTVTIVGLNCMQTPIQENQSRICELATSDPLRTVALIVTSMVRWNDAGASREATLIETLYDWR